MNSGRLKMVEKDQNHSDNPCKFATSPSSKLSCFAGDQPMSVEDFVEPKITNISAIQRTILASPKMRWGRGGHRLHL